MSSDQKLTGKQLRHLRALAHDLKPIVQLGKHGLTDAVQAQVDRALLDHELIKVKLGGESPTEMAEFTQTVTVALHAHLAQVIGNIAILYRRHPQEPKISLPRAKKTPAKQ
ncbi:MAG TPA: ribosome assembly RNA-binding protein YhbY [Polyangiaceae bacterium]|nr:ribosome assembly RNA-binding protein YhbY [Polyangiaceae bacterium]